MKRTIAVLLSLLTVLAIVNFGSISTQAAYKGQTRKNTYCTVKISKKLIIKKESNMHLLNSVLVMHRVFSGIGDYVRIAQLR